MCTRVCYIGRRRMVYRYRNCCYCRFKVVRAKNNDLVRSAVNAQSSVRRSTFALRFIPFLPASAIRATPGRDAGQTCVHGLVVNPWQCTLQCSHFGNSVRWSTVADENPMTRGYSASDTQRKRWSVIGRVAAELLRSLSGAIWILSRTI